MENGQFATTSDDNTNWVHHRLVWLQSTLRYLCAFDGGWRLFWPYDRYRGQGIACVSLSCIDHTCLIA